MPDFQFCFSTTNKPFVKRVHKQQTEMIEIMIRQLRLAFFKMNFTLFICEQVIFRILIRHKIIAIEWYRNFRYLPSAILYAFANMAKFSTETPLTGQIWFIARWLKLSLHKHNAKRFGDYFFLFAANAYLINWKKPWQSHTKWGRKNSIRTSTCP